MERFHEVYSIERRMSQRMYGVRVETDKNSFDYQTRLCVARSMGEKFVKPLKIEKNKNGQKNQS